ncbi:MAG: hypothetical protein MZV65_18085 [Chromatiales bacterium]|nr:hypothetical protein [Chromatiales bacterium]
MHIGYLAAIVAASNAGGSGSVVGDTTTTMMWIDGVAPLDVLHAYVAAARGAGRVRSDRGAPAAGLPADPEGRRAPARMSTGRGWASSPGSWWRRSSPTSSVNTRFPQISDAFPFLGAAVWVAIVLAVPLRKPEWSLLPDAIKGSVFLLSLVVCASMMPVEKLPPASWQTGLRPGLRLGGVRQHSADRAGAGAGRLRLGRAGLRGGLRRLHDLVRLVGRRGAVQPVPGSASRSVPGSRAAGTWRWRT